MITTIGRQIKTCSSLLGLKGYPSMLFPLFASLKFLWLLQIISFSPELLGTTEVIPLAQNG